MSFATHYRLWVEGVFPISEQSQVSPARFASLHSHPFLPVLKDDRLMNREAMGSVPQPGELVKQMRRANDLYRKEGLD